MSKKSWIILIVEALVFILVLGLITKCQSDKIDRLEHNVSAYRDTIEYVETRNGELMAMKESLILSESQAREELEMTKAEMKELKKALGEKVSYIAKLKSQVELKDTVWMKPDTVYAKQDGTFVKKFNWKDKWTSVDAIVSGESIENSSMAISNIEMDVPLQIGLSDDYRFWAKSENPNVVFTDIKSVVVNDTAVKEKEKRFHHGIYVGFGVQYGLFGKQWDFGPQAGYALMYSF